MLLPVCLFVLDALVIKNVLKRLLSIQVFKLVLQLDGKVFRNRYLCLRHLLRQISY